MLVLFDEALLRLINSWASIDAVAYAAIFLSSWIPPVFSVALVVVLFARAKRYHAALAVLVAMGTGDALTARILKPTFDRPRPCHVLSEIQRPAPCGTGRSMPSGHATVAFAFLASAGPFLIRIQRRRLAVGLAILAIGVAGARVVLGVHYPSDVLVGAVVGGLVGWMIQRGFTTIARSFE